MSTSTLRKTYDIAAVFALVNMLVFGGLAVYVIGSGMLAPEKIERIAAVLRGEEKPTDTAAAATGTEKDAGQDRVDLVGQSAEDASAASQMEEEIARREAQRIRAELDQRIATVNQVLMRVTLEREAFERQVEAETQRKQEVTASRGQEGFKKELEYFESLAPKVAVQHLLAKPDADEAARILLEMETGKGKKIIEAAKRGNQMERMKVILQRLREVAPAARWNWSNRLARRRVGTAHRGIANAGKNGGVGIAPRKTADC